MRFFKKKLEEGGQLAHKPIFVIGTGRCGTGLLYNLLSQSPELVPTAGYPDGEDHFGWIKYGNCKISGLGSTPKEADLGHTGHRYCLYMDEKDVTPEIVGSMHNYYLNDVLRKDSSKRVINKCPHLSNKLRYVRAIFPDAKFIHIVRDCLPVVSSFTKIMDEGHIHQVLYVPDTEMPCLWFLPAPEGEESNVVFNNEKRFYPGAGIGSLAEYWVKVNRNIPLQLSDTKDQLLTVKYEDVCANPEKALEDICNFCEIGPISDISLKVHNDFNEKYKSRLTEKQMAEILDAAKEVRTLFGYEHIK